MPWRMPVASEHDTPLTLVTGPDPRLKWARRVVLALAGGAVLVSPAAGAAKLLLGIAWAMLCAVQLAGYRNGADGRLVVYPDGRCRLDDLTAKLDAGGWTSGAYCVVRCRGRMGTRRLLVSASRQPVGQYRKLRVWLRLGRWVQDAS